MKVSNPAPARRGRSASSRPLVSLSLAIASCALLPMSASAVPLPLDMAFVDGMVWYPTGLAPSITLNSLTIRDTRGLGYNPNAALPAPAVDLGLFFDSQNVFGTRDAYLAAGTTTLQNGFIFSSNTYMRDLNYTIEFLTAATVRDYFLMRGGYFHDLPPNLTNNTGIQGSTVYSNYGVFYAIGAQLTIDNADFYNRSGANLDLGVDWNNSNVYEHGDSYIIVNSHYNDSNLPAPKQFAVYNEQGAAINKLSGLGTSFITRVNNAGAVNSYSGILQIQGGTHEGGTFSGIGGTVEFVGTHDFVPSASGYSSLSGSTHMSSDNGAIASTFGVHGTELRVQGDFMSDAGTIVNVDQGARFVSSGTATLNGTVTNAGTFQNDGVLTIAASTTGLNDAFNNTGTFVNTITAVVTGLVVNDGTIANQAGASLTVAPNALIVATDAYTAGTILNDGGTIDIQAGALVAAHVLHQSAGTLRVNGTLETYGDAVYIDGGDLRGAGTINATVNITALNGSTPRTLPGNSPGTLTINGDFNFFGGEMGMEVVKNADGTLSYDRLIATHTYLDGTVRFLLGSGLTNADVQGIDDFFACAATGSCTYGTSFSALIDGYTGSHITFDALGIHIADLGTRVAAPVPVPPSFGLLAAAIGALSRRRRAASAA
jgi:hypothetical protein